MTDNMREFVKFFVMGSAKGGVREPIAYLYNGVRLPKLPEWDKTKYPYAYIGTSGMDTTYYYLCFSDTLETARNISRIVGTGDENYTLADGEWGPFLSTSSVAVIWTNTDIYYIDSLSEVGGTLCLAASDPIPVYE